MAHRLSLILPATISRSLSTSTPNCIRNVVRKITRLKNDYEVCQEDIDTGKLSENDVPPLHLVNRNPRNLEQLLYEMKPLGFDLEAENITYWNRVELHRVGQFLEGRVVHYTGRVLVTASTGEETLIKYGVDGNDKEAAKILGFILARRSLEAGILFVDVPVKLKGQRSEKERAFLSAFKEHGIRLKEPEFLFPRRLRDL